MGFGVKGLGFRLQGLGSRFYGLGLRVAGVGLRVEGVGFRVWDLGFRGEACREMPSERVHRHAYSKPCWGGVRDVRRAPREREIGRHTGVERGALTEGWGGQWERGAWIERGRKRGAHRQRRKGRERGP